MTETTADGFHDPNCLVSDSGDRVEDIVSLGGDDSIVAPMESTLGPDHPGRRVVARREIVQASTRTAGQKTSDCRRHTRQPMVDTPDRLVPDICRNEAIEEWGRERLFQGEAP